MSTEQGAQGAPALPQSQALLEASAEDSLQEVMSRDPEGYTRQDRDRIIAALRAQRERIAAAEAAGPVKKPRGTGGAKALLSTTATKNLDDMGL